jgi:hypothetical protein
MGHGTDASFRVGHEAGRCSEGVAVRVPRDAQNMLHIFQLIVFGFLALIIVIIVLTVIGGALGTLISSLRSSYDATLRRPAPNTSCGHGPNDRIETLTGSGGYCRACETERQNKRQRTAERDWEARKKELMRDNPPLPRR